MNLNERYRFRRLDPHNIIIEEFKEVKNVKTKELEMKWVHVAGYYGTVAATYKALAVRVTNELMDQSDKFDDLIAGVEHIIARNFKDLEKAYGDDKR